jgi:hypothetical protein
MGDGRWGSAGLQPAVSPIWNRRGFEISRGCGWDCERALWEASKCGSNVEVGRKPGPVKNRRYGRLKTCATGEGRGRFENAICGWP